MQPCKQLLRNLTDHASHDIRVEVWPEVGIAPQYFINGNAIVHVEGFFASAKFSQLCFLLFILLVLLGYLDLLALHPRVVSEYCTSIVFHLFSTEP